MFNAELLEGIEVLEDVWSDLHTLKRLYGLLQRTDGLMTPQQECLNIVSSFHLIESDCVKEKYMVFYFFSFFFFSQFIFL